MAADGRARGRGRGASGAARALALLASALALVFALAPAASGVSGPSGASAARAPALRPHVASAALSGLGALAFVWRGRLWAVADGRVADLGPGAYPVWSRDGAWLAFLRLATPVATVGRLWLARASGAAARPVRGLGAVPVGGYAWVGAGAAARLVVAPTAVAVARGRPTGVPGGLWLVDGASGARRRLVGGAWVNSFAVGDGVVAYSATLPYEQPVGRSDALYVRALAGGPARRLTVAPGAGIEVAAVTAGGQVLYWLDPLHSASLAADGMGLEAMATTGGRPRALALTLGDRPWVVPAGGGVVYVVEGGGRAIAQDKVVATCDVVQGRCHPAVPANTRSVSLDPAACPSPTARAPLLAFVRARDLGQAAWGFVLVSALGHWVLSRRLWVFAGHGAHVVAGAGPGVYAPACTARAGVLLYLRAGGVWLVDVATGRAREVVGGFWSQAPSAALGYYGYRDFGAEFAWAP